MSGLCDGELLGSVNTSSNSGTVTASTNLKIVRKATTSVVIGRAVKADSATHVSHATNDGTQEDATVLGVAENSASPGDNVTINLLGVFVDASYASFSVNEVLALGINGQITSTPIGHTYLTTVAKGLGSSSIQINVSLPVEVI